MCENWYLPRVSKKKLTNYKSKIKFIIWNLQKKDAWENVMLYSSPNFMKNLYCWLW